MADNVSRRGMRSVRCIPYAEYVDYWIPLPETRRCRCGHTLSWWNRTGVCHVCQGKHRNARIEEASRDITLTALPKVSQGYGTFGDSELRQGLFLHSCGMTMMQIADRFGVSWITVQRAISGHRYKCRDEDCDCHLIKQDRGRPRKR